MQQTLETTLNNAVEDYDLAVEQFPEAVAHLELQKKRWARVLSQVFPGTSLNTLDIQSVLGDYLAAELSVEATRLSFRTARARIDRMLLQTCMRLQSFNGLYSNEISVALRNCRHLTELGDLGLAEDAFPRALTIEQASELAVRANLDLLAAKYSISSAEADELTAGLWNNPSVLVDTVFQPFASNWNQTSTGGPRQYDLIFSYPFDLSGTDFGRCEKRHVAKQIIEATFQDAVRQKILQVRLAYIDLLVAGYQLSLSRDRQESMSRLVTMIQNKIGSKGRLPLLQRRAQLALDQAVLVRGSARAHSGLQKLRSRFYWIVHRSMTPWKPRRN